MQKQKIQLRKRIAKFILVCFFAVLVTFTPPFSRNANARIVFDPIDFPQDIWNLIKTTASEYSEKFTAVIKGKEWAVYLKELALGTLKQLAIQKVNNMTTAVITGGNNGKPYLVTDWNQYLLKGPQDEAMVYVNSLLNNSLRGRDSAANYSNPEYYSYLQKQAMDSISPKNLNIAVASSTGDLKNTMFADGNMKAFNEYLQTGKNPYSLSVIAASSLENKTKEKQLIAEKEQTNGYIPKKDALGNIMTPAAFFQNAMDDVSTMGTGMIVNATKTDELVGAIVNLIVQTAMQPLKEGLVKVSNSEGIMQITAGINTANAGINAANQL